jgi:hypothetical protein
MNNLIFLAIPLLLLAAVPNVFAGGPRLDYVEDNTKEGPDCWVNGYDSGFAGKYDSDRAKECLENGGDQYNRSWSYACRDGGFNKTQCADFINNPVVIDDYESLGIENDSNCYNDGREDGEADRPFNKDRDSACDEFGDRYGDAYRIACESYESNYTASECTLKIEGEKRYCPKNPDIVACVDFLHNATNKMPESKMGLCTGMGDPRPQLC